jgi:polyketide biosynthesis acyl carrier protein
MERDEAFAAVLRMVQEVLPGTTEQDLRAAATLTDLGATSIDRAEIAVGAMEALGLRLQPAAFLGVATIAELVELLARQAKAARG